LLESLIFLIIWSLYWICKKRRCYLKKRFKGDIRNYLQNIAKNIAFMVKKSSKYRIEGEIKGLDNGAVLYSCHFGVWEKMPGILVQLGYKTGIIVNRYADYNRTIFARIGDHILYRMRGKDGVRVFYKNNVREIIEFIRNKGVFCALIDGDTLYAKYQKIEKLAKKSRVPLISFALSREDKTAVLRINCNLERIIAERPYDYWWFYKSRGKD